jgi:outer membrane protein assembly factor BamB
MNGKKPFRFNLKSNDRHKVANQSRHEYPSYFRQARIRRFPFVPDWSRWLTNAMKPFICRVALLLLVIAFGWGGHVNAQTPLPAAANLWTAVFPGYQNSSSSTPAVAPDGTIYIGTFHGDFMAYTPDGMTKWSFKAGAEIKSSPAIADDGTVYFGSRDRKFYAFNPAGKLKWKFETGAWVDSSPAVGADGTVYFGGWDRFFYALNPKGSLKWKMSVGAIVDSSPAIARDGTIYFGAHDKKLYALQPNGSVRWTFTTGGAIVSSPAIGADGTIYFSSADGNLYAVNPDGSKRWFYHTGSTTKSSPVVDAEGNIYAGKDVAGVVIDANGREQWGWGTAAPVEVSAAAVTGRFYFSVPWRTVQALTPGDVSGDRRLWTVELEDNASSSLTVGVNGTLYVCAGFSLYAIRPPGELLPPAKSPWPMFRANPRHTGRVEN